MDEKNDEIAQLRLRRNQFIHEGNWEKALAATTAMIAIFPTASRYIRRSMLLLKLHRYNEAFVDIEKALELNPKEERAKKVLAKLDALAESDEKGDGREPFIYTQTEAALAQEVNRIITAREKTAPASPSSAPTVPGLASAPTELVAPPVSGGQTAIDTTMPSTFDTTLKGGMRLGNYMLQEKIGQGGMGSVYKAIHTQLQQVVAIKILPVNEVNEERVQRFEQEAYLAAKLQHPHIVPIFNFGVEHNIYYLVMQWVDGIPLNAVFSEKKLSPRQALDIMCQVAQAMAYAHAAGVIHRDLKPSNVMIDRWGRALVLDFGLAKSTQTATDITRTGQILGTPKYMSPEQAAGDLSAVDEQSDVYAMGAMLYELLTGKCPFDDGSPTHLIYQILHMDPVAPKKVNPRLHSDLQTMVMKAMDKEKSRRYANAHELEEDINRYLHGETILARPPRFSYRFCKWTMRHPALSSAIGLSILFIAALVSWYNFFYDPHCKVKTMYRQAQSEEEKNVLLNTLVAQVEKKDIPFLREVFAQGTTGQKALALRMLADVGAPVAEAELEAFFAGTDDELVRAAIYAAGKYRRRSMVPRLRAFLAPGQDWRVRLCALEAIAALNVPESIPLCVETLCDNCTIRETAQKILLQRRDESVPYLLDALLGDQTAVMWEAGRVLVTMGPRVLPQMQERMPACDAERQIRILKVVAMIQEPEAIRFVIRALANPDLERKAFALLLELRSLHPQNTEISEALAGHQPHFFILVEAQCFGVLNEKLRHNIKIFPAVGSSLKQAQLHIELPGNVEEVGCAENGTATLDRDIPSTIPQEGILFSLDLIARKIGSGVCKIDLRDGDTSVDHYHYSIEVVGVAGAHCSMYDTEDPIPLGGTTVYVMEVRNEGHVPLTNLRFVSQTTPELGILKIEVAEEFGQARIDTISKEKGVVFSSTPLAPGEKFSYQVTCKAVKVGSALLDVAFTYDQFAREINLSEGTVIYWR